MQLYRLAGAVIRSELPLDGYANEARAGAAVELTLTICEAMTRADFAGEDIVNRHAIEGEPLVTIARHNGGYCMRFHGHADYLVERERVACIPEPGCSSDLLTQLFVHRVLPNVMSSPTTPVLHASAVARDGRAVMLLGDPGAGKSTLASAMVPPSRWLSDDCTTLALTSEEILVQPGSPFARLWPDSLEVLGNGTTAARGLNEKWRLERDTENAPRALRAMFVLGDDAALRCERLSLRDEVAELARHLFRIDPSDRRALRAELETLEHIATNVPMFVLHYPRRFDAIASVCDAVFDHMMAA